MTLENLKKQHAHLKWLSSGEFNERDFDYKIDATPNPGGEKGEGGWSSMGEMKPERRELIKQDAQRTLERFEVKYPKFKEAEKPEEIPIVVKLVGTPKVPKKEVKKEVKKDGN